MKIISLKISDNEERIINELMKKIIIKANQTLLEIAS